MHYAITRSVLSCTSRIELTEQEYERLRDAKRGLVMAVGIEEIYRNLRQSYMEYEHELFMLALDSMMHFDYDWALLVAPVFDVNRRVLNFVAAARQYRDHVNRHVEAHCGPGSEAYAKIRDARITEKKSLESRFMEALRNYIQHHGIPVSSLNRPSERVVSGTTHKFRHGADPRVSLTRLAEDQKTSASPSVEN